jgi:hypothetical protein
MADTSRPPSFGIADSPHAPFIYYEAAPAVGTDFGVIQITLSAHRLLVGSKNETIVEPIAVAHLRGTRNAARLLRDALNTVLSVSLSSSVFSRCRWATLLGSVRNTYSEPAFRSQAAPVCQRNVRRSFRRWRTRL